MEKNDIFKFIQKAVESCPLILVGSGGSAPYGLASMEVLGQHLLEKLTPQYKEDLMWNKFVENISSGQDLETALSKLSLKEEIINDIKVETWNLVSEKDLQLFNKVIYANKQLSIAKLINKFYQAHPKCVNIVTTNYDRVIEYACDSIGLPFNTGFSGLYLRKFTNTFANKNIVNIVKVHGSLDVFKDVHNVCFSVPLRSEIPSGLVPEIVTPGLSKFQAVLKGISRDLLTESDTLIKNAPSFLCIGYGFNDEQIQEKIISGIRLGKPIIVVTKQLSDSAAHLITNNAVSYVTIQEGPEPNTTEFCINKEITNIDGCYWSIDGFMEIID